MRYALLVAFGAALWATDALFRHPLVQQLSPFTIVYFEHIFATFISFVALMCSKERRQMWLGSRDFFATAFIGVFGSAVATVLFTMSFQMINPSVAILLQKIQPIFVIIMSFVFLGESLSGKFFIWAGIALIAAYFVSFPNGISTALNTDAQSATGCFLAVLAALIWSISTVAGKLVLKKTPASVLSFWRFAFGLFAMYMLSRKLDTMRVEIPFVPAQHAVLRSLFLMALVPGFLAVTLYYKGLKKVPASAATILELSFPVCAIAVNAYFLNFHLSNFQLLAAAVLVAAMVGVSRTAKN
jgi:drug/metabolite transporter (DMT)-like permease